MKPLGAYLLRLSPPIGTTPTADETAVANLPTVAWRLTLLVLIAVLPVLGSSAFMFVRYAQNQRIQFEQKIGAATLAASLAIDGVILHRLGILTTLRNTRELKERDWHAFHELAKASVAGESSVQVTAYDPSGQAIVSTSVPFGASLPKAGSPDVIRQVTETRKLYVSNLHEGVAKDPVIGIYVPVIETAAVSGILSITMSPEFAAEIMNHQALPKKGIGVLIDGKGIVMARTMSEKGLVGHSAAPGFVQATLKSDQGFYETPWSLHRSANPSSPAGQFRSGLRTTNWTRRSGVRCRYLPAVAACSSRLHSLRPFILLGDFSRRSKHLPRWQYRLVEETSWRRYGSTFERRK
jgi:hypothetical protein